MVDNFAEPQPIKKNLVFWNQHVKFYPLIQLEKYLRWWVDWLEQLAENDPSFFLVYHINEIHLVNASTK